MTSNPSLGTVRHWRSLDALRGIAILSVIAYHCLRPAFGQKRVGWVQLWDGNWTLFEMFYPCTLGWWGVSLFFVISGFCIHHAFLLSREWTWQSFLARRFWRIYPPYLAALLVFITTTGSWEMKSGLEWWKLVSHFLLLFDFDPRTYSSYNGSFWSIAVEFQLYLLYPALLALRSRMGIGRALLCLLALATGLRLALLMGDPAVLGKWRDVFRASPLVYWFDWALGAFLAENMRRGRVFFSRWPARLLLVVFVASTWHRGTALWSFTLASLLGVVLVERFLRWEQAGWQALDRGWMRALSGVGVVSYSLYLWHQPMINAAGAWLRGGVANPVLVYALLALVVTPLLVLWSVASHRWIELPASTWGRRLARKNQEETAGSKGTAE